MERFLKSSLVDELDPVRARSAMAKAGVGMGSMETFALRQRTAIAFRKHVEALAREFGLSGMKLPSTMGGSASVMALRMETPSLFRGRQVSLNNFCIGVGHQLLT